MNTRVSFLLAALAAGFLAVCAAGAQTLQDNFSAYAPESDGSPQWDPEVAAWSVVNGAYEGKAGFSLWRSAPYASAVTFSCDVTVLELLKGSWLAAGITLGSDDRNFWALQFNTEPEDKQRRHHIELHEMRDSIWLAQNQAATKLAPLQHRGGDFNWQMGQTYRFEITLSPTNVIGRILQATQEVACFGYRFDGNIPAVKTGRPAVRVIGMRARFDNAQVVVRQTAPEPALKTTAYPAWVSRPGQPLSIGTGFFRVLEQDGRWWLVDPEGKPFFDVGTDHVSYRGHWCEKLGYAPYLRNVQAKYGSEAAWGKSALERLRAWGFNTLPAGHSPSLRHQGLPHILFASFGTSFAKQEWICEPIHWTGFPDVFSPRWETHCRIVARKMARDSRGDPWCIGTFLDNELEWYGKKSQLVDEVFRNRPNQPSKQALYQWLVKRFGSHAEINRRLGTAYADAAAFQTTTNVPAASDTLTLVRTEFLALIAERYFGVAAQAMRQADPDHLVLGCRFAGRTPESVLPAAGKYNDVFTFNTYPRVDFENCWRPDGLGGVVERAPRQIADYFAVAKKPIILTEWSFPALDSGLPCKHGAGMRVDTQDQKAACYRIFANTMADLPFVIGYHYFMWADEPALGISSGFPEDSNYGLVNEQDAPYDAFVKIVTEVNQQAATRHARSQTSGYLQLLAANAKLEIANTNSISSHATLRLVAGGREELKPVSLKPGERLPVALPANSAWCAELQQWDSSKVRAASSLSAPNLFVNATANVLDNFPVVRETTSLTTALIRQLNPGASVTLSAAKTAITKPGRLDLKSATTTWSCSGKTPAIFDSVKAGDLPLGQLIFLTHQEINGQQHWAEPTRLTAIELQEQPDAWIVEAEVERAPAPKGMAGYTARVRVVVFKALDLALVRPLWIASNDMRPWTLVEAYWFVRPLIGGSPENDVVGGPAVANYYRSAQFVTDSKLGGCFGALDQSEAWRVTFWADPNAAHIHPDCRYAVDLLMRPGQRWTAENIPYLWVYASRDAQAWKKFATLHQRAREL